MLLGGRAQNDRVDARTVQRLCQVGGGVGYAVALGNVLGRLQPTADQAVHFNAIDLADAIEMLLAKGTGAGYGYFHVGGSSLGSGVAGVAGCPSLRPVQAHGVVHQQPALLVGGRCDAWNHIHQRAVVRHVALHVRMGPVGAPEHPIGEGLHQQPGERGHVGVVRWP